jgi:hypothetical protein
MNRGIGRDGRKFRRLAQRHIVVNPGNVRISQI